MNVNIVDITSSFGIMKSIDDIDRIAINAEGLFGSPAANGPLKNENDEAN